ncbi:hypothetical protein MPTK1_4g23340 [Marchantia polymorpha subsp. ruderalis]|nr:hypothetical protein MARPO_0020s0097 [Marchantia polymorpha]PTQ44441.1 hypothetical protein MARPO_0020s0097 [Marchantia polymorpha]BBN09863.1 hypothetical protein Mp_4g23340 [Marchantia polymorpha subsp. ruderalis]BBN09864.1 hypothetical protein Mp_4g23340 [Marchantia polymorpha subsp. ruderalis]|eukprot:PTQ44440.1 hypothetical protein MARPO_0020s0097 [Marchantia polymorpha]
MKAKSMLRGAIAAAAAALLLLATLNGVSAQGARCNAQDSQALLDFKASLVDEEGIFNTWVAGTDCCQWNGVAACDPVTGRVTELNLGGSGTSPSRNPSFKGVVGESLGRLSGIGSIVLEFFDLQSEIPASLGQLSNLFQLVLGNMGLVGKIPASIGNLVKLQNFNVNGNALVGPLPVELCKLVNIKDVDFGSNQIGGNLPACIGTSWLQIEEMDFRNNLLTGPFPNIGNLQSLLLLWLNKNKLSGRLPSSLGRLTKLERMDVSENQLSGPLPKEIGNMKGLTDLVCSRNKISGSIPAQLGNLDQLAALYLDRNQLSGSIPTFLGNFKSIRILDLSRNKLVGSIPPQLGSLTDDESVLIDISFNRLTGPVPPSVGGVRGGTFLANNNALTGGFNLALARLSTVNLANNRLSDARKIGTLPTGIDNQLIFLNLANNKFSGMFPSWIFEPSYIELDLSGNKFRGSPLPFFDRDISNLNLSSNPLATTLPTAKFKAGSLSVLDLSNCQLSGPITSQFLFNLNPAVSIYFKNNKLSGPLPQDIGTSLFRCSELDLSNNLLNGTIPASFSRLDNLNFLDLSGNQFEGNVPSIP